MLRLSFLRLGRWGPRDFIRGRTKRAGAVHVRHTHGSKGRYKRHSTLYTLRSGRRHVSNHMKGGLGIKLGGGLFGLRIPRQHSLSTMTREAYELEVYGHPNITNPYRGQVEAHPGLRLVMENAMPTVEVVVILPRVARISNVSEGDLPLSWGSIAEALLAEFRPLPLFSPKVVEGARRSGDLEAPLEAAPACLLRGTLHLATLAASVRLSLGRLGREALQEALLALHREHQKGQIPLPLTETTRLSSGRRRVPFLGPALRAEGGPKGPPLSSVRAVAFTSAAFAYARALEGSGGDAAGERIGPSRGREDPLAAESPYLTSEGVGEVLRRLREGAPDALGLCLRPLLDEGTVGGETGGARSSHPTQAKPGSLLKADVDQDEVVGVWRHRRYGDVKKLLRWYYASRDPRAHNSDQLPHRKRRFSIILLVDASKTNPISQTTMPISGKMRAKAHGAASGKHSQKPRPSLMSKTLSENVERMGFKALQPTGIDKILAAVQEWSVEHQWSCWLRMGLRRQQSPLSRDDGVKHDPPLQNKAEL
ncbi:unnamed protein product [Phytomonas sp. EM1]|nr:unnamed protein product [Phytomonas sp. EM1]|eukprot:CCW61690.1 unnamed protein product [Phytomonas sp. isolate EM1]